jgi:hypothetical protein
VNETTNSIHRPTGKFQFHNSGQTCLELTNSGNEQVAVDVTYWPDDLPPLVVLPHTVKLVGPFPVPQFTEYVVVTYTPSEYLNSRVIEVSRAS